MVVVKIGKRENCLQPRRSTFVVVSDMAEFSIESNGLLPNTAVYFNGQQLREVKEIFLNLDEEGTFDAIIQYGGRDGEVYTKSIFNDYLEELQVTSPLFTEEESRQLTLLTVASDGDIESTYVVINGVEQSGIVSLYVHIKAPTEVEGGLFHFFDGKKDISDRPEFKAEVVYREENDRLTTEGIF